MLRSVIASLCFCLVMSGCVWIRAVDPEPEAIASSSAVLLPVTDWNANLLMQQRVTIRWRGDLEESFDAVLQKQGSQLLLLGMGPMNQVGFSLSLDDHGVHFDNRSGRDLPFQPERILADVQRVFYPWIVDVDTADVADLSDVANEAACFECERHGDRSGFDIREKIGAEFIVERRFKHSGDDDDREIVIHYQDWHEDARVPVRAVLDNEFYGYGLTIETLSVQLLESDQERSTD